MPRVRIEDSEKSFEVGRGANLRRALMVAGLSPHTGLARVVNCQGMGLCGSCWVKVIAGAENLSPPTTMEKLAISRPLAKGRRLSCQTRVYGDCTISLSYQP